MNSLKTIDGALLSELLEYGYKNLAAHFQIINDLNVFPVPDGDTGTNMKITYANGISAIEGAEDLDVVAGNLARGMLYGARGNSGVLTSQYFRGLANGLEGKKVVTVREFADAMVEGYKTAYKAAKPATEGTILTVAREGIESVIPTLTDDTDLLAFFSLVVEAMRVSLDNTPNLLAVLKESGVVDSGGKGLLTIFEGYMKFLSGQEIDGADDSGAESHMNTSKIDYSAFNENSVLDYGYCTEFLLQLLRSKIVVEEFDIKDFIEHLTALGNSIVCFQNGTIVKVHIHTKTPYEVIEYAQRFGEFVAFKMENMALQHNEVVNKEEKKKQKRKPFAVVTIGQGDGIIELFKDLGADVVLNGGQTMNTSAAEMIEAFKQANAKEIILLPNESNILMAAKQAKELAEGTKELGKGTKVRIIPTKTIPQGYSALSMMMNTEGVDTCYETLKEGAESVVSCFVTKSSRDSNLDGVESKKGQYIESVNGTLVGAHDDRKEAVLEMLSKVPGIEDKEVVFIFYGQMMSEDQANEISEAIQQAHPNMEVGVIAGGQDVYDLLIGVN